MMHKLVRVGTLISLILISLLTAQQRMPSKEVKVLGVTVKGNKTISDNSVRVQSGLIEGETVTRSKVEDAITKLWNLGFFGNVQIYVEKSTDEGVFLLIELEEYPRVRKYEFKGNKKVSTSKIKEETNINFENILKPHIINKTKRKIKELYADKGFLRTEITTETFDTEDGKGKRVVFHIKENEKVRIDEIKFAGNKEFSDWRLHRVMKDTKERFLLFFRVGKFEEEKYEEDKKKLYSFYRKEGYRDFEILSDTIYYTDNKKRMNIKLSLYEGERYKYRNITFSGNSDYPDKVLKNLLDVESGDWYNEQKFQRNLQENVAGLYMNNGYLYTNVQPQEIPVGDNQVDIHIKVNKNHQVEVGQIMIAGNDKTFDTVIRRNMKIYPGQLFDRAALQRSLRELHMLNYFSEVTPEVLPVEEDEVDLEVSVKEKSSDRLNFSVSYSQIHGLIGGGGVTFNNFLGRGQQLQFSYQRGTQYSFAGSGANPYQSLSVGFTEPWLFNTPNLVGASFQYMEQGSGTLRYYPYDLRKIGGSLRYGRRFRWPDNYFQGSWSISYNKKEYSNIDEGYENYLKNQLYGHTRLTEVQLSQIISRDSRDMPEFPTQGSQFTWRASLSGGPLGGNEAYHKHRVTFKFFSPLFWEFVLMNNMEFGVIEQIGKDGIVPPEERFIMGGAGMIYGVPLRGYEDNRVGPLYSSNSYYLMGGKSLFKYSMEFRLSISKQPTIYALTFAEAGNVWQSFANTDPFDLKRSAGAGIRFIMPQLGMIGVDFGYGFDNMDPRGFGGPEGWKTHFIFGRQF
ncbi:MAG: outer membrane protein assembly factor BamA [Candidatus Marinimicrobia bacterium]|nr:outer membrane protein assembly factor BamA [Candidatus Neomarinimicrobiota bacterium]